MLGHQLVVVSDAHLGAASPDDDAALLQFFDQVPSLGDCLLVNGDLFDFWFSYRRVVPRTGFLAAAAIAMLGRKLPVVMTGGNHDRWGDSFWGRDVGITFSPGEVRFAVGRSEVLALHGDGVAEEHQSAMVMHRVTSHPATVAVFRALHPTVGLWLVERMSRHLADSTRDPSVLDRAQGRQRVWAEARMQREPAIDTLIMSHTHRFANTDLDGGRRYLNPGAWIEGRRYAIVTESSIELKSFD
jgi:UDP-2,3-diacylglucosamine hydrolase